MWYVYLIQTDRRSYVGCTTDVRRRLRQHNREIVGGARSTRSGAPNWKLHLHVEGFTSKSEAMRWERIVKSRCRGLCARSRALIGITHGHCPVKGNLPHYQPPDNLAVIINVPDHLKWGD